MMVSFTFGDCNPSDMLRSCYRSSLFVDVDVAVDVAVA
jgi:hypothetical protein